MKISENRLKSMIRSIIEESHVEEAIPVTIDVLVDRSDDVLVDRRDDDFIDKAMKCISMAHDGSVDLAKMCLSICEASERKLMMKCIELCMCACKCDVDGCCRCLREICQDERCAQICKDCCGC